MRYTIWCVRSAPIFILFGHLRSSQQKNKLGVCKNVYCSLLCYILLLSVCWSILISSSLFSHLVIFTPLRRLPPIMEGDGLARPSTPIGNFRQAPSRSSSPYSDAFMAKIISRGKKVKHQLWLKALSLLCTMRLLVSLQIQVIRLLQCILLRVYLFALIFSLP